MDSRSPLTVCLYIQLSVCLLGSTASATTSLWGKKVQFNGRPCMWQLQPGVVVPALEELSVCLLLRRNVATEWTGFVYKAPGGKRIELGLGGSGSQLTVWLFGERVPMPWELKVKEWYSVCLTWSGRARRLRTYINGTLQNETLLNPNLPQQLAPNGTLTLGVSHNVNSNWEVQPESGNNLLGEISRFRIWSREWSAEELRRESCADGDVVRWDQRQWKHGCPPVPDNSLHCAWSLYKIKMWTLIVHTTEPGNCVVSPEEVTRGWLDSIFPHTTSVHDISVSSPSRSCPGVNDSAALHVRQPQGSTASADSLCDKCFRCEVNVNVNPAANVEAVQADITALLSLTFSYNFLNLSADPSSIMVLPVESLPVVSEPPTAVTTTASTSETGPTQSRPAGPVNVSTTGDTSDRNLSPTASATTSLWGKKVQFNGRPCMWQLQPGVVVPALEELSVCLLLRRNVATEWTGFVYKAPGGKRIELGLGGSGSQLTVWLFGERVPMPWELKVKEWYSVCLTWSGRARRLRTYINGTLQNETLLNPNLPQQLAPNGTLTLGVSHNVNTNGEVQPESGNNLLGEISQFRIWSREWSAEELRRESCADGDVVRWDQRQWKHGCPPVPDNSLHCESFPVVSEPPTAFTTTASTSETGPTQSRPAGPANVSTTGDPSDRNLSAFGPDTFFRVDLTLQMNDGPTNPKVIIKKWVKESLEVNGTMIVLNLVMKEKVGRNMDQNNKLTISYQRQKHYYCAFHVQEYKINSVPEIITSINSTLTSKHENGSVIIEAVDLAIKQILPENCLEETRVTIYGEYIWPAAFPQEEQEMVCRKPPSKRARRLCKLDIKTDMTSWATPDMKNCKQLVTMTDLFNITVTTDNAADVVDIVQDLVDVQLSNSSELSSSELDSVVRKLNEVVDISVIQAAVGADIIDVIAVILLSETNVTQVATTVLKLTDRMADNMFFSGESVSVTAPSLALSMINVAADGFKGLTFGVSSVSSLLDLKTFVNWNFVSEPLPDTDATISLPSELNNCFTRNTTRVQFQFHGTPELFQDTTSATQNQWKLNSYIVSASINDTDVSNLSEPVVVTLSHHKPKLPDDRVQCMFWDFRKNGGLGGWNGSGCETRSISPNQTSCLCDHLTNFAVLLDVSRIPISEANSYILTLISYLGCGISSIFLGITLLTYLVFEKLRRDHPSKILINLSAALLGLSMLFLLDSWFSSFSSYGLCIATAATLHYFLLASFTWMGLEAVNMYLALVKVFNIYVPSYILKFCAVGWGIPLVIVGLVLAIDKDAYGNIVVEQAVSPDMSTDPFCWLQDDIVFFVTVVAFILLILLGNIAVFVVVLIQIRQMRANKPSAKSVGSLQDLRAVASLTVLLGLTWSMGFFSFGPGRVAMMYLFSILNTLQGFFIFLFHCVMKDNVRKQWRIHLCCGRFRLSDYSDWSRSATVGGGRKKNHLINSGSSDNTSSIRKVSDSSTDSAPQHHQGA